MSYCGSSPAVHDLDFAAFWYEVAVHAVQMKEHLKGVSSSLVLIDDIHLYVLKAEGPHLQHTRSDTMRTSISKVCSA